MFKYIPRLFLVFLIIIMAVMLAIPVLAINDESNLSSFFRKHQEKEIIEYGDRNLDKNIRYPEDAFYHNGGRIIDITKEPFNAKGDGQTDDTESINKAYNFIADQIREHGWKNNEASYVIYFPEGEYLISDTIIYDGPRIEYEGYNWGGMIRLRIIGENRKNTEIRLKDNSPGFESDKDMIAFQKEYKEAGNNIPSQNALKNITINTGNNNPGARAVTFLGANTSSIENVTIKSEDGQGKYGLFFPKFSVQGYYRDITIDGFDYGIKIDEYGETQPNLEYITLKNQNNYAILVSDGGPSIRKLHSINQVPVLRITGNGASVVLVDSLLVGENAEEKVALEQINTNASFFGRNIEVEGYELSLQVGRTGRIEEKISGHIEEFVSGETFTFDDHRFKSSLNLTVEESPVLYPEEDMDQWANVNDFPGNNDTQRIQNAMNSGKSTIYFPDSEYYITRTIRIPSSVKHVEFMYTMTSGNDTFLIEENSEEPLFFTNGPHRKRITQRSSRTIVMRNTGGKYRNMGSKQATLFIENAANLGTYADFCPKNQTIWARSINNEYKHGTNFKIYGGQLWTLGFKLEGWKTGFDVQDGGVLETLGGYRNQMGSDEGSPLLVHSSDSLVSMNAFTSLHSVYEEQIWKNVNGDYHKLNRNDLPERQGPFRSNNFIPLYTSYDLTRLIDFATEKYDFKFDQYEIKDFYLPSNYARNKPVKASHTGDDRGSNPTAVVDGNKQIEVKRDLPGLISEKRMEELILSKIEEEDRNFILDYYLKFSLEKLQNKENRIELSNINEEDLLGEYKLEIHNDKRSSSNKYSVLEHIVNNRKDIDSLTEIRFEHLTPLIENPTYIVRRMPLFIRNEIIDIVNDNANYNIKQSTRDHLEYFYVDSWFIDKEPYGVTLDIDLEDNYEIDSIKIHSGFSWGEEVIGDFKLQYRYQGIWKDIPDGRFSNNKDPEISIVFNEEIITNIVRFKSMTENSFRIREIEILAVPISLY